MNGFLMVTHAACGGAVSDLDPSSGPSDPDDWEFEESVAEPEAGALESALLATDEASARRATRRRNATTNGAGSKRRRGCVLRSPRDGSRSRSTRSSRSYPT